MGGNSVMRNSTNTVTSTKVKISLFVQRTPGDSSTGIAGLKYEMFKGRDLGSGKTDADGRIKIETDDTGFARFGIGVTLYEVTVYGELDTADDGAASLRRGHALVRLYGMGFDVGGLAEFSLEEVDDGLLQFEAANLSSVTGLRGLYEPDSALHEGQVDDSTRTQMVSALSALQTK
jgi:hypothetical protein